MSQPNLRLTENPAQDDVIPFPGAGQPHWQPRLCGRMNAPDIARRVDEALDHVQRRLDNLRSLLDEPEFDPDHPRAA